jgi:hypothetical protein
MGGYGPATTGFSRALKMVGDWLGAVRRVSVQVVLEHHGPRLSCRGHSYGWSSMDCSRLGYQSSGYLTDRVPELGFLSLALLVSGNAQRAAMDGTLGGISRQIQERIDYRILDISRTAPPHF